MAEHHASVTVAAPAHQVYELFAHFNDYPKFMTYVKEVTYLDAERSHWVVDMFGVHEWDAVNEEWIADRQIGWRSTSGIPNSGRVTFTQDSPETTVVRVAVTYEPPGGLVGTLAETLVAGTQFEHRLQHDLEAFATMVEAAPPGALDPTSSAYLYHQDSAATLGRTTTSQQQTMGASDGTRRTDALLEAPSTTSVTEDDLR